MITRSEGVGVAIVALASGVIQYFLFQQSWTESIGRGVVIGIAVGAAVMYRGHKHRRAQKYTSSNDT